MPGRRAVRLHGRRRRDGGGTEKARVGRGQGRGKRREKSRVAVGGGEVAVGVRGARTDPPRGESEKDEVTCI